MARVRNVLDQVETNGVAVVTLHGAAGMGKSRFLKELIEHPDRPLEVTAVARCSAQPLGPYNDLVPLLRDVLGPDGAAEAWGRLHALAVENPSPRTADELAGTQFAAFADVIARLLRALQGRRALLAVDDLHWARPALLRFIEFLLDESLTTSGRERLLVVLASRPLPPEHHANQFVARLERSPRVHRLELAALDEPHEAELIRLYCSDPSPSYLGLVRRSSHGNPLRIRAAVDVLNLRGVPTALPADDRRVQGRLQLPLIIDDPVAAWLEELPVELHDVLAACSVLGDEFSLGDLTTLIEPDDRPSATAVDATARMGATAPRDVRPPRDVTARIDPAVAAGALGTDGDLLWFAHPQYRELLYESLPASRRRELHARRARQLGREMPDQGGFAAALEIGHHLLRAGGPLTDPADTAAFIAAGDAALAAAAWDDAATFYGEALRRLAPAGDPAACLDLRLKLGQAHYFNHDAAAASSRLLEAAETARAIGDEEAWCNAVVPLMRVSNIMHTASYQHPADATPIEQFLAHATQPRTRALALEVMAETYIGAGQTEIGDEMSAEALRLARQAGDNSTLALCHFAQSYADMTALRVRASVRHGREAMQYAAQADDWYIENAIRSRVAFATFGMGDLDEADRLAEAAASVAAGRHEYSVQALGNAVRCAVALLRGDARRAEQLADVAAADTRRSGHASAMYHIAPLLVFGHLQAGRPDAALAELAEWPQLPRSMTRTFRNLAAVAAGRLQDVEIDERDFHRRVTWMGAGVLVGDIAVAIATRAPRERLELAESLLRDMSSGGLIYTLSYPVSLERLRGDVLLALGRVDEARSVFEDASAANRAAGAYPELARSMLGLARAEASRRGGSVAESRRLAGEALRLAEQVELQDVARTAAALGRTDVDLPASVASRGGTWTVVLVADVVGSTQVSTAYGDLAYHRLVSDHHEIVRRCITRRGGHVFSEGGDSLFVWFSSTREAVAASVAIHDAVTLREAAGPKLQVKIVLAGGEPLFSEGRPFGLVLNRAARLLAAGVAGETLVDEAVAASAGELGPGIVLEPRGLRDLPGIGIHRLTAMHAAEWFHVSGDDPDDS